MSRNMMSLIKLKCSLDGCGKIVPYNIFHTHIEGCSFNPDMKVTCLYCFVKYKKAAEMCHVGWCQGLMRAMSKKMYERRSPLIKDREYFGGVYQTFSIQMFILFFVEFRGLDLKKIFYFPTEKKFRNQDLK